MTIVFGSAHMDDEQFLRSFHGGGLPAESFRHGDHLRLAWLHLHRESLGDALGSVLATHDEPDFAQFLRENQQRLDRNLLHRFWSPDALNSEAARRGWLAPDREPLPACSHVSSHG